MGDIKENSEKITDKEPGLELDSGPALPSEIEEPEEVSAEIIEAEAPPLVEVEEVKAGPTTKEWLYEIIFEADTFGGRAFDIALLLFILGSVIVVMLDSVRSLNQQYTEIFRALEWFFTIAFTIEYCLRLYCSPNRLKYATSFFGSIDLLSTLPTYVAIFLSGAQYMMIVRILRLLRLFRILKLGRFLAEADTMVVALKASGPKISVFLFSVLSAVSIVGAIMYLIEPDESGFTSIPISIYWAIVTLTTVGYGDIAPQTILGQILACTVMILGYGIIAVPTGIVSVEMHRANKKRVSFLSCNNCGARDHQENSTFCNRCGTKLNSFELDDD